MAGSRHKDQCHWFVNRDEMDALSGAKDRGIQLTDNQRMITLAQRMSANRTHFLAVEYLQEEENKPHAYNASMKPLNRVAELELRA